jgi:hypothetical protein
MIAFALIVPGLIYLIACIAVKQQEEQGYRPHNYITRNFKCTDGEEIEEKIPLRFVKIVPPKGGTAAVYGR